jgi:hypothetical protein
LVRAAIHHNIGFAHAAQNDSGHKRLKHKRDTLEIYRQGSPNHDLERRTHQRGQFNIFEENAFILFDRHARSLPNSAAKVKKIGSPLHALVNYHCRNTTGTIFAGNCRSFGQSGQSDKIRSLTKRPKIGNLKEAGVPHGGFDSYRDNKNKQGQKLPRDSAESLEQSRPDIF